MRRPVLIASSFALAFAACTGSSDSTEPTPIEPPPTEPAVASAPETVATTEPAPVTTLADGTAPPTVDSAVSEALQAEIAPLVELTEQLRGLEFIAQPQVSIISKQELEDRLRADLVEQFAEQDLAIDTRLWRLFGLLEPAEDLETLLEDLLAEQVVGFYDGETAELVVSGDSEELSAFSKSVVVHELTHALSDQHFFLDSTLNSLVDDDRFDEASALQAVAEGEATFVQLQYILEELTAADLQSLSEELGSLDVDALRSSPPFLAEELEFPYDAGFVFISDVVADGGVEAINRVYDDLPSSTEQILHPDLYRSNENIDEVALVATAPVGYELYEESTFGELGIKLLFVEDSGLATQLAAGWGGDTYRVYSDADDIIFVMAYQGDNAGDAEELAEALVEFAGETMGAGEGVEEGTATIFETEEIYVRVGHSGDRVTFIASSDPQAGASLAQVVASG
jgi:hypothetical protein